MAELFNDLVPSSPEAVVLFAASSFLLSRRCMVGTSILRESKVPKLEGLNHTGLGLIRVGCLRPCGDVEYEPNHKKCVNWV